MEDDNDLSVLRVNSKLHADAKKVAEENEISLKSFVEAALEREIDRLKYGEKRLLKILQDNASLRIHRDLMSKEFLGLPSAIIRDVIPIIEDKDVSVFKLKLSDVLDKLKSFVNDKLYGFFIKINAKKEDYVPNEVSNLVNDIDLLYKDKKLVKAIDVILNNNGPEQPEALLVISFKKEEKDG